MPDRRHTQRRTNDSVPEPLERSRDRRAEERRDSPRKPIGLTVRWGSSRVDVPGTLSLGGASCGLELPPPGDEVLLGWTLPDDTRCETPAQIVGRDVHGRLTTLHISFGELPTREALALAKWLETQ